ncbi:trypsin-like peptidase [Actinomadura pelletieri DSM 43383]|uniref:Trypsin-like peptidase n=1 Tax=Actinomadura pelletieri DSM 43383 TaxID=1120940 RepID=A0A495QYH8_9ACTN|nr:serine protease [Actinomadura pelletieri]RKS79259.1 trypsin-like peptidase [Actinomadura pelletieri DSM 43383]
MQRRIIGALAAAFLGAATLTAGTSSVALAAPAPGPAPAPASATAPRPVKAPNFTSIIALSNCSGSLVRVPGAADTDPALVLTNGHCIDGGMPSAGQVIKNQSSSRSFTLLNSSGGNLGTLRATSLLYATMTDTDAALYKLSSTYADIQRQYSTPALEMVLSRPSSGGTLHVVSGYWKRIYTCRLDGFAYRIREANWTWKDSLRYTRECNVIGGTSGSPAIDDASGKVIGVNNTINESGGRCTMNNPCEVDEQGQVTVRRQIGYAQQTYTLANCIAPGTRLDMNRPGCTAPR